MSSLFGNLNVKSNQPTPSLFGNTAPTPQTQQGSSLFQNLGQNQPSGGLFGSTSTSANSQTQQAGGLFGSAPATQAGTGLFGQAPASQPQQSGGLFGTTTNSQPQQAGGLFGSTNTQPPQGSGLFGAAANSQPAASGGLFGTPSAVQPQQIGGGLFGSSTAAQPAPQQSNISGNPLGQNQNQNQTQTSLFGNTSAPAKPAFSLFGNNTQTQQQKPSLFGSSTTAQPTQQTSIFGASNMNQSLQQGTSLFGSSNRPGGLTMGQNTNQQQQQQQQQQTVPGVRIDVSNVRGTTRFNDLHEELQKQIEQIDAFIQQQIAFKEQCDAIMPAHEDNVSTIPNDVEYLTSKLETTELALYNDVTSIDQMKGVVRKDADNSKLSFRAIETLKLPQQFHYSGMWHSGAANSTPTRTTNSTTSESPGSPETIVSYFSSTAAEFRETLGVYERNISDIEVHLRTLEASIIQQGQQMMFRRGADGKARSADDQVRELAAVLREFEGAIVGVAEKVGNMREGVSAVVEGGKGGIGARRGK